MPCTNEIVQIFLVVCRDGDSAHNLRSRELGLIVQGYLLSYAAFALAIRPTVQAIHEALEEDGRGGGEFGHDDGYIFGPPEKVMEVLRTFERAIQSSTGCRLRTDKSAAWHLTPLHVPATNAILDLRIGCSEDEDGLPLRDE